MTVYVALLRGINVGGHNPLPMADLRAIATASGLADVETYIQSGNVVGRSRKAAAKVGAALHDAILDLAGIDARVVVRSRAELGALVAANPFLARAGDEKHLHVSFLFEPGDPDAIAGVDPADYAPDEVSLQGVDAYLHTPNGFGRAKIASESMMRRLGIVGTVRSWRTVTALAGLAARVG